MNAVVATIGLVSPNIMTPSPQTGSPDVTSVGEIREVEVLPPISEAAGRIGYPMLKSVTLTNHMTAGLRASGASYANGAEPVRRL